MIPQPDDGFKLTIGKRLGISEVLIIASKIPLQNSLKALKTIAKSRGIQNRSDRNGKADKLLDVTNYLLDDLDTGVRGDINIEGIALPTGVRGVDTKKLAAMAIACL